jgi:hypothetical protein
LRIRSLHTVENYRRRIIFGQQAKKSRQAGVKSRLWRNKKGCPKMKKGSLRNKLRLPEKTVSMIIMRTGVYDRITGQKPPRGEITGDGLLLKFRAFALILRFFF